MGLKSAEVLIILVNYKRYDLTFECIKSICSSSFRNWVCVVWDNDSNAAELDKLKRNCDEFFPVDGAILFSAGDQNLGFARGVGSAIRAVKNMVDWRYVWLLNNDCIVDPEALGILLHCAQNRPNTLFSSKVLSLNKNDEVWFEGGMVNPWTGLGYHVPYERFRKARWPFLSGCSLFVSRSILERFGFLDESIFLYWEDTDFSLRLIKGGVELDVVLSAVVKHHGSASTVIRSPVAYRFSNESKIRILARHFGVGSALAGTIVSMLRLLPLLFIISPKAVFGYVSGLAHGIVLAALEVTARDRKHS